MVDPLSQQVIQDIANKGVEQTQVEPSAVSTEDATAFRDMVGADANATQSTVSAADPTIDNNINKITEKPSMGDRILQGLENAQNNVDAAKLKMATDLQADNTVSQMYNLQLQVSQFATNQQVLGQVGSKSSQGIQTLLKGQ